MTDTTIGYAVLQIIPSLKGVTEAIDKQLAGKSIPVDVEPKVDPKKVDKSVKDAVKKKPVEVELEPKIDASKIDPSKMGKPPKIPMDPKIDGAKVEQQVKDAVNKAKDIRIKDIKIDAPKIDPDQMRDIGRNLGTKLRGSVLNGLRELNNNPALKDIQEQLGQEVGAAIGQKIGDAIRNSPFGQALADALGPVAAKADEAQQKFGALKDNIKGTSDGLLGLTNNSGKIAGGLSQISSAAGPLAGVFTALSTLMPGFSDAFDRVLAQAQGKQGFNAKDWANVALPQTNLMDTWANGWVDPSKLPRLKPGQLPPGTGMREPKTPQELYMYGPGMSVPMTPGGGAPAPRPAAGGDSGTLGSSWRDGIVGPGTGDPVVPPAAPPTPAASSPPTKRKPQNETELRIFGPGLSVPIAGRATGGVANVVNGMIRGPGTGTSDSILGFPATVRVSAGEFITNEKATEANLPLLQAVNSGVPLWDWLKQIPRFGEGGLVPGAQQLRKIIMERFGISDIGGYRAPDGYNEHSTGRALDVMVGGNKAKGDAVKDFALANASSIDLKWAIWQQRMWYPGGRSEPMSDRGSPTQNHMDHVHIFSGPGITNGLLGALRDQGPMAPQAASPAAMGNVGDGAAAGAAPAESTVTGGSGGSFSMPSSLTDLAGFGLSSLGKGMGATSGGSDLSLFGSAAGAAVSGQVDSVLGAFGVPSTPRWLQAASQFVSGISIGGHSLSGGIGVTPASASMPAASGPATIPDAQQQSGGVGAVYNIKTATVEDAFMRAQRLERERAAAKLDRF